MLISLCPPVAIAAVAATYAGGGPSNAVEVTTPAKPGAASTVTTVHLKEGGKTYDCPADVADQLKPIDERAGQLDLQIAEIQRQLHAIERRLNELDAKYPGNVAPTQAIAKEYNGLASKGRAMHRAETYLVTQYNEAVDSHNRVLRSNCS
jgi:hypothetical protein